MPELTAKAASFFPDGKEDDAVPVYSPREAYEACVELGVPTEAWLGKVNSFLCPLGEGPGTGMILLLRKDLDSLIKEKLFTLKFEGETDEDTVEIPGLSIISAKCVAPSYPGDPGSLYYVEIADRRYQLARIPLNKRYNVLKLPECTEYADDSKNGESTWSWSEVVANIWGFLNGDVDGDVTVSGGDGIPENLDFSQDYALHALSVVLDRLGYALRWDVKTGEYSAVEIGGTESDEDKLDQHDDVRIWDDYADLSMSVSKIPSSVEVVFMRCTRSCEPCHYKVDRPDPPEGEVTVEGSSAIIYDDLIGRDYSGGGSGGSGGSSGCAGVSNSSDLSSRATARAETFYRLAVNDSTTVRVIFSGWLPIRCAEKIKSVRWFDTGRGAKTEVYSGPELLPPYSVWNGWYDDYKKINCGAAGGGTGSACITGPYEIVTISQQVCCNSLLGFSATPWYVIFSGGGMHFFEDREEARCYHIALGRDGTFLGECS